MTHFLSKISTILKLLKTALVELLRNDPLRMAGATAFFTTFALPPILVIIIQAFKYVIGPDLVRSQLFGNLTEIVGAEAVQQLSDVLLAFRKLAANPWITIGGFIFLLFVATTLFRVIKNSINQLWKIKASGKTTAGRTMLARLTSILVILVAGVLLVAGLITESAQVYIGKYLSGLSPILSAYFNSVLSSFFSILITTCWFVVVFRYLPDGKPRWKIAWVGGLLTSLLFMFGKILLHWMLSYSNINNFYGASASIVLLLLFVFYSSLILYYGACFTKAWAIHQGEPIKPRRGSMHYRLVEVSAEDESPNV